MSTKRFWQEATKRTYEDTAKEYTEKVAERIPHLEIKEFAGMLPQSARMLDIGCGSGRDAKEFLNLGMNVVGIDFSCQLIQIAKTHAPLGEFHVMDMESLVFPDDSFEGIWSNCSLLHIPKQNLPSVLSRVYALLKPEGYFYLSVKKGTGESFEKDLRFHDKKKFWSFFEEEEIQIYLRNAGFQILNTSVKEIKDSYQSHPYIRIFCKK